MIVGVLLRSLGWPLKLVFTSAAQRHHSWITRWLIRRMDAIIATSDDLDILSQARSRPSSCTASIPSATRRRGSRGGIRGSRLAGPLRDRLLRPGARAKGQRRVRRGDVPAVAALSRFHRGHGRRDHAGADGVRRTACGKRIDGGRPAIAHRHHGRTADRRKCRAGTSG